MLKAGFAKEEVTPRLGVELAGFGPFLCRNSTSVHDKLWARAMAVQLDQASILIISCDLIGLTFDSISAIKKLIIQQTALSSEAIFISCTHTHSGPSSTRFHGWGEVDLSYYDILPYLIAKAGIKAVNNLQSASLHYATVSCSDFALNREAEPKGKLTLPDLLAGSWQPAHPDLVDQAVHVVSARAQKTDKLLGLFSSYSCHPVVCCEETHAIHGDFCGVASTILEQQNPDAICLFLQGAHGDVNTCYCHQPEDESLKALQFLSAKYAQTVTQGINCCETMNIDFICSAALQHSFARKDISREHLEALMTDHAQTISPASDRESLLSPLARRNVLIVRTLKKLIHELDNNRSLAKPTILSGLKLGPLTILGSGFETFQAIKRDLISQTSTPTLVCSLVNDGLGYAVDNTTATKGSYASEFAPYILETLPYANIHDELVSTLLELNQRLS